MGDWFETVVDPLTRADEAASTARAVVEGLVEARIIEPAITECALGASRHAPAAGVLTYLKASDESLFHLKNNGLEVVLERRPHISTAVERITCPHCHVTTSDLGSISWGDAINDWYEGGHGEMVCPSCTVARSVAQWQHEPQCDFGNLAFTFWNWPPFEPTYWHKTPAAVIEALLGYSCVLVNGKL